ncbi:hypothetical protein MKX01_035433 [Papaver californicum]|nr:hypothetical protein MKX01_035433 [Papaver californicum]
MSTIELISKHIIQPSTPTPCHLKNYSLSLIDQYVPPIFVPTILFYPAAANSTGSKQHDDDLELLKWSLSETLVHVYPMAGRLKDNITVNCNDEGVEFIVVKIKGKMCDFLMEPDEQLSRLLPSEVVSMNLVREAQVIIQVNVFKCCAIAISLCISHKIADMSSVATFIRSWAHTNTMVRGGIAPASCNTNQKLQPTFESAALFPPSKQLVSLSGLPPTLPDLYPSGESKSDNKILSKRFVFDWVMIDSVRGKLLALIDDKFCRPTRVELVSALIWKSGDSGCILDRTRGDSIEDEVIKVLWMTSWCNFGFYEIDFGWGRPIWVTTDATLFPHKNNFVMNDTICGEGIEVWVNLVEDDMASFQVNLAELLD